MTMRAAVNLGYASFSVELNIMSMCIFIMTISSSIDGIPSLLA